MLVGINTYHDSVHYPNLQYCENDANDWDNHLSNSAGLKFNRVEKYFDSSYGCDGKATEYNVKQALNDMVDDADSGDIIVFIFSGHGYKSGEDYGLCMWDCEMGEQGENGILYDTEIKSIFEQSPAEKMFLFFDSCYSFGIKDTLENLNNKDTLFFSVAANYNELAFEDKDHYNGCWTHCFLEYSWQDYYSGDINEDFEYIYQEAEDQYDEYWLDNVDDYSQYQSPKRWNPYGTGFCLSKYGITPP